MRRRFLPLLHLAFGSFLCQAFAYGFSGQVQVLQPNVGQFSPGVEFGLVAPAAIVGIGGDSITVNSRRGGGPGITLQLVVDGGKGRWRGEARAEGRLNYLVGDAKQWRRDVATFTRVSNAKLLDGIEWTVYPVQSGIEHDFVISPGADPRAIRLRIRGGHAELTKNGDLVITAGSQRLMQRRPVSYQTKDDGTRERVMSRYILDSPRNVRFEVGPYDRSRSLTIDPILVYSTFLGGSGDDEATGIAVDGTGAVYVTGTTGSANFPASPGYQSTFQNTEAFVTKLAPGGASIVYTTYIGGSLYENGRAIAVNATGEAVVVGATWSSNFPTAAAYDATYGGGGESDAFVLKLNAAGNGLVFSTYLGADLRDYATGVALGPAGDIYVTGVTNSAFFPTVSAFDAEANNGDDVFVTRFAANGSGPVYSTFLGGFGDDEAAGIAVDSLGRAYVTGLTWSTGFPRAGAPGAIEFGGTTDCFVTALAANGQSLIYSRFLGGSDFEQGRTIAVASDGVVTVGGRTNSSNFPVINAVFQGGTGFVSRLSAEGIATYSTYFPAFVNSLKADAGGIYIASSPTDGFPTVAAYDSTPSPAGDAGFTRLTPSGSAVTMSTFLGGDGQESATALAIDTAGNAYIAGFTTSADFPVSGGYDAVANGQKDAFVAKLETSAATVAATITSTPPGLVIAVDGANYATPKTFNWVPGTSHSLSATSPQYQAGSTFTFSSWSQGGSAAQTIAAPATAATLTALYAGTSCQYQTSVVADNPIAQAGGAFRVNVTTQAGCPWTFQSNSSWIAFSTGICCTGSGYAIFQVDANGSGSSRTGSVTVGGQTYNVNQTEVACPYSFTPPTSTYPAKATAGSVVVTTGTAPGPGCAWSVIGPYSPTPASGNQSATVEYTFPVNRWHRPLINQLQLNYPGGFQTHWILQNAYPAHVAAFDNGYWLVDANGNLAWDGTNVDRRFFFSLGSNETPIVGDWNGDGAAKAGVYRNGTWLLDYNGNGVWDGPVADRLFYFGGPGYVPLVGKFNGYNASQVAVYKDGTWLIDTNANFAWDGAGTDTLVYFGGPGYVPYVGSWSSSLRDMIAVHKDGTWIIDHNGNFAWDGTQVDRLLFFGGPGYVPVLNDWNGDGLTDLAVYLNGTWIVDFNGNFAWDGIATDRLVYFGGSTFSPVSGDWNGDGKAKVGAYADGLWVIDLNGDYAWNGAPTDGLTFIGGIGNRPVPGRW